MLHRLIRAYHLRCVTLGPISVLVVAALASGDADHVARLAVSAFGSSWEGEALATTGPSGGRLVFHPLCRERHALRGAPRVTEDPFQQTPAPRPLGATQVPFAHG